MPVCPRAADQAAKTRDGLRAKLAATAEFPGVTGLIKFDEQGDSATQLRYFMVENFIITTGGIVAGLLLALGLNRLLIAYTGMPRLPIEYMAYGAAALWVLGLLAVYGPASKAASISPAIATRTA